MKRRIKRMRNAGPDKTKAAIRNARSLAYYKLHRERINAYAKRRRELKKIKPNNLTYNPHYWDYACVPPSNLVSRSLPDLLKEDQAEGSDLKR